MDTTFGARIGIDMDSALAELAAFWRLAHLSSTSVQDGLDNIVLDCTQSKSMIFEALKLWDI